MKNLKYSLFASRRFLPMFLATFLGTFNDNVVRSGLVVLIAYSAKHGISLFANPEVLVTLCSALLVLPMVLFSSIAGQLADKYDKAILVNFAKLAEIFIMLGVCYGFYNHNIMLLMSLLFISGTHTTFYIPIKFSILPQHLQHGELLAGNGFIASGSYLAILSGMIAGGLLVDFPEILIGIITISVAVCGFISSLFIPNAPSAHPETVVSYNLWRGSMEIITHARRDPILVRIIISLSWFIVVGFVYISQFANYTQGVIHADNKVYIVFLTVFSVGMAVGSLLCDTLLKGQISTRFTPIFAVGVALFTLLMVIFTNYFLNIPLSEQLQTAADFFGTFSHLLIVFFMFMVAVCGGVCMVPLYAALQDRTNARHRSQIIAASNLSDSISMSIAAILSIAILSCGIGVQGLFVITALITLLMAQYARKISD
jgi:acyl-[acyl-carrier-protein]-phospholipid O-acyltransferase/long-chain-fatty-acid--[acyl-carrier-protein] ligase